MRTPAAERVRARVVTIGECWLFQGATGANGYGVVNTYEGTRLAHRVMWEAEHGPVPNGLELDHLCRVRACVNPAHLEPVSRKENVARGMWRPGIRRVSHCKHGHQYTIENSWYWRTKRYCRTCLGDQQRAKRARQKADAA